MTCTLHTSTCNIPHITIHPRTKTSARLTTAPVIRVIHEPLPSDETSSNQACPKAHSRLTSRASPGEASRSKHVNGRDLEQQAAACEQSDMATVTIMQIRVLSSTWQSEKRRLHANACAESACFLLVFSSSSALPSSSACYTSISTGTSASNSISASTSTIIRTRTKSSSSSWSSTSTSTTTTSYE